MYFSCAFCCSAGRAVADTASPGFPYSARAGAIERDRKDRLQQTPSPSRNRIRQRRSLPLFRRSGFGVSRVAIGGIKSALLRFQYQETLSFGFGSAAPKGARLIGTETFARSRRALVAGPNVSPRLLHCNRGISPVAPNTCRSLFREVQAAKPARRFRLEAGVTLWLKEPAFQLR